MRPMRGAGAAGVLDMLPPDGWWHDPKLAAAVTLKADQFAALDKLSNGNADEAAKLERDSMVAVRDLRSVVQSEKPSNDDIVTAANRVKTLRDSLFDRQVEELAAQRTLLTQQQWDALQGALAKEREMPMDGGRRGGYGGGGRRGGGFGGRGRFPG